MPDCLFCGKRIPAGAASCPHCRGPVGGVASPAPTVPTPPAPDFPEGFEGDVLRLLAAGQKIEAIKLYRERTGSGLKESKEAVEALGKQHGIAAAKGGCAGVVLAVVTLGTAAAIRWLG